MDSAVIEKNVTQGIWNVDEDACMGMVRGKSSNFSGKNLDVAEGDVVDDATNNFVAFSEVMHLDLDHELCDEVPVTERHIESGYGAKGVVVFGRGVRQHCKCVWGYRVTCVSFILGPRGSFRNVPCGLENL